MCYTYDSLIRVIKRQVISLDCDCVVSEENYNDYVYVEIRQSLISTANSKNSQTITNGNNDCS